MKKKEFTDIKMKPTPELERELEKDAARLRELKTQIVIGKVKSLKEMHALKRSVAQLRTLITERAKAATK